MESSSPSKSRNATALTRRGALAVISGSLCAAIGVPISGQGSTESSTLAPVVPSLGESAAEFVPQAFTKPQLEIIAALSEAIIPTDAHSPGANAAHVDQFIDEIVAASDETTRRFWIDGLAAMDKFAHAHCGKTFIECAPAQQTEILQKLSAGESHPVTLEEKFFVAIKRATVDGYYNSGVGIHQDLQYQGNTYLAEFKGCAHANHISQGKPDSQ